MLSFIVITVVVGGELLAGELTAAVEYFGPLNITIPPLSIKCSTPAVVHINGVLYSCGGTIENFETSQACYKYDLASNSSVWENFTSLTGGETNDQPAVAFPTCDFFWYFNRHIEQVPLNGGNITTFDWGKGFLGCAVGNGSNTVLIPAFKSSVLMNSDPLSPQNWTTIATLKPDIVSNGCLWLGNTIYVTGGLSYFTGRSVNKTYLINTDTFEVKLGADMPYPIYNHAMGIIDGNPAVFGGYNGSYLSSIYVYDSATNTWSLSDRSLPQRMQGVGIVTF